MFVGFPEVQYKRKILAAKKAFSQACRRFMALVVRQ
jgi:hypothetical protein